MITSNEVLFESDGASDLFSLYSNVALEVVSAVSICDLHDLSRCDRVSLLDMPLSGLLLRGHAHLLEFSPWLLLLIILYKGILMLNLRIVVGDVAHDWLLHLQLVRARVSL